MVGTRGWMGGLEIRTWWVMSCLRQVWHLYGVCGALCRYGYWEMDEYRKDAKRQQKRNINKCHNLKCFGERPWESIYRAWVQELWIGWIGMMSNSLIFNYHFHLWMDLSDFRAINYKWKYCLDFCFFLTFYFIFLDFPHFISAIFLATLPKRISKWKGGGDQKVDQKWGGKGKAE